MRCFASSSTRKVAITLFAALTGLDCRVIVFDSHRPVPAAPHACRLAEVPAQHRPRDTQAQDVASDRRQRRHPPAPGRAGRVGQAPAAQHAIHADAEKRRRHPAEIHSGEFALKFQTVRNTTPKRLAWRRPGSERGTGAQCFVSRMILKKCPMSSQEVRLLKKQREPFGRSFVKLQDPRLATGAAPRDSSVPAPRLHRRRRCRDRAVRADQRRLCALCRPVPSPCSWHAASNSTVQGGPFP